MMWKLLLPTLVMFVSIHQTSGENYPTPAPEPVPPTPAPEPVPPAPEPEPPAPVAPVCATDVVFIVDDSSSVSSSWFGRAKQFIIDFLQCFTDQDVGIGVILFNCVPRTGIPLGMYTAADAGLPAAISLMMRQGGLSRIGQAISFMTATTSFRHGVPKAVVILTDGMPQSDAAGQTMDDYEAQAIAARNAGIDLYAVGIGGPGRVDFDVLETITGSEDRLFRGEYNPCKVAYRILANLCASAAALAGCMYGNAVVIPVGYEYKPDDCTMCTCDAAGEAPACAVYSCAPPPCDNPVRVAGQCCPVCDFEAPAGCLYNGAIIPVGEEYKPDDCTTCTCEDAGEEPACVLYACAPPPCDNPVKVAGQCCPVCDAPEGCWYNRSSSAVLIPFGIEYKEGACESCHCYADEERAICLAYACRFDFCTNLVRLAGQCCPDCPACCQGCYHGDDFIPVGATFQPDPCTFCGCYRPGEPAICAVADCAVPPCVNLITPPGECCPVCADIGCEHPDGIILPGEPYQVDGCMTCYCGAAGQEPLCATAACLLPPCDTPVQIAGQCCPVCEAPEGCPYNGMIIPLNDSFKPDDCTTCTCSVAGEAPLCIAVSCALPPCPDPVKIAGQCCPTCP
ncbi:PREDICTED: kielin/chordin-like protein isoform X1 [Branchiostoma belcheri]|uniref:Kielin/chordin-like protein isoform X1 n=1 Tax=Branchiostoma belcheri TaxID=7741 RepID=A0A6P5AGL1_BRABE|nr:PREDICTED: kielin/chordin-like protein isoform X1 [Branchiostoma belcheri]